MGKTHSKNNEYLVCGFVRRNEDYIHYYIPAAISQLILKYYPDCNVYGIGRNGLAELGLGEIRRLQKFELLTHLTSYVDNPSDIHYGDHRFLTRNIYNELHCAGKNINRECGVSGPDMLKSFEKIKDIKLRNTDQYITIISNGIASRHTFVCFNDGTINAFGWNMYGQFGNGKQNAYAPLYSKQFSNLQFQMKQIACGQSHTLFLTSIGTVFSAGMNHLGQCGIKTENGLLPLIMPALIPTLINITAICCGQAHNLCIDENKKVWIFGSNEQGQLGIINENIDETAIIVPIIQETLDLNKNKIGKISCGINHSLFIDDEKNEAYLCGNNVYGQIGNNKKDISQVYIPYWFRFEDYTNKIIDGSCGSKHTILITTDPNILITFGANNCFQCSSSNRSQIMFEPYKLTATEIGIKNPREVIEKVIAGYDTTLVATRGF